MKIGILFDLDGTLLNTLEDLTDATNYTLRHFGCPERSIAEMRQILGNGALRQMTLSLPGKPDDPDIQEVLAFYKDYYDSHSQIKTRAYEGVEAALAKLAEKYTVAIVSNKPDPTVKSLCAKYFPGFYALGESAACPRKPAPDMVFTAMKELGVERCIFVGDSEVDVLTAQNAGVPCLTVLWGFRDKWQLEESGAQYFCDDAEMLPALIDRMAQEIYGDL